MSGQDNTLHNHIKNKKDNTFFDKFIIAASFMCPLSGIPQLISAMGGNVAGISISSWSGFTFFALIFFIYGLKHRVIPMVITNLLWLVVDLAILMAVLYYTAG